MIKKSLTDLSKYLFLVIFLGFFASNTLFNHIHLVDGYAIVHSHPFKSDSSGHPVHSHPLQGFILVNSLNCFLATVAVALILLGLFILQLKKIVAEHPLQVIIPRHNLVNQLRGPPQAHFTR